MRGRGGGGDSLQVHVIVAAFLYPDLRLIVGLGVSVQQHILELHITSVERGFLIESSWVFFLVNVRI